MKRFIIRTLSCITLLTATSVLASNDQAQWSYDGKTGPTHWSEIAPDNKSCALGHEQSPINIEAATTDKTLPQLHFHYQPAALKIINNGHTVQVNIPAGSFLEIADKRYQLVQFHMHTPSEESIHGKHFPLVAHLVHQDETGKLVVVAIEFKIGENNAELMRVIQHLPREKSDEQRFAEVLIDPAGLLPRKTGYYTFTGSLTTPPCSEGVTWFVLKQPQTLSRMEWRNLHSVVGDNARPIQPLNDRKILQTL